VSPDHFYCLDPLERDMFLVNEGYVDEDIACHVLYRSCADQRRWSAVASFVRRDLVS
jgi:hypothetical protein